MPGDWRAFGPFHFDLATGELRMEGRPVALEPQPARLLAALVSRPGEIVTRRELAHALWGEGTHVAFDDGLNYAVRALRIALADAARAPRFIQTLPRRGYRFVAPVSAIAPAMPAVPARRVTAWSVARVGVVAVLALLAVAWVEQRPNTHHAQAVRLLRAVHGLAFGR